jgi:phosphate transport system substrate-binding protein
MRNKKLVTLVAALSVVVVAGMFSGCSSTPTTPTTPAATTTKYTGSITAAGSTALQPLADAAQKLFVNDNPDATVSVQGGGSGAGLTQISTKAVDIGMSDVAAEDKLKADQSKDLVDHQVCVVGFAAIVNSSVTLKDISKADLIKVFTGQVKNWKEIGGNDLPIVIINRAASSGTRAMFKKYALDGKDEVTGTALTEDSSGAVKKGVQNQAGSISYLASSYLLAKGSDLSGITVLSIDKNEFTADNIKSGKYPVWAYEHMYTNGTPDKTSLTQGFIDYLMKNDAAKKLITDGGYIAIGDMTAKH